MNESADITYYQSNREVTLNRAEDYYEKGTERLRKQAGDEYRNLSEEKKIKKENVEKTDTEIYLKKKNQH